MFINLGNATVEAAFIFPLIGLFFLVLFDVGLLGLEKIFLRRTVIHLIQHIEGKSFKTPEDARSYAVQSLHKQHLKVSEIKYSVQTFPYLKNIVIWNFSFTIQRRFGFFPFYKKLTTHDWVINSL
ncbi:MAG: TadE/TadG family type IV pilus assembly protein [Elusimicrobiota bacterium]